MPVIINEFEVVPAPEPKSAAVPAPTTPMRPLVLKPEDVERIDERRVRRRRRLWAD
jgi:hypothetical protein